MALNIKYAFINISLLLSFICFNINFSFAQKSEKYLDNANNSQKATNYYKKAAAAFPNDIKNAEKFGNQALFFAKEEGIDSLIGHSAYLLAKIMKAKGNLQNAIDNFTIAEEAYVEAFDWTSACKCNTNLNVCYELLDNISMAYESSKKALEYAQNGNYKRGEAIALMQLGSSLFSWGDYDEAIQKYESSLKIADEIGHNAIVAKTSNNIGLIYHTLGRYEEALDYYQQAYEIQSLMQNWTGVGDALNNIGRYFAERGEWDSDKNQRIFTDSTTFYSDLDSAKLYFEKALGYYEKGGDAHKLLRSYANLGTLFSSRLKNFEKANEYFQQAYKILEQVDDSYQEAVLKRVEGDNFKAIGNYPEALNSYKQGLQLALKSDYPELIMMSYKHLSEVYDSIGNCTDALHFYKKYYSTHEELKDTATSKYISVVITKYETKKKEDQLKKAQEDYNHQQQQLLWSLGILVMIAVFSILMVIQFLQKRRANKLLQLKNEEITMQKEEIETQRDEIESQKDLIEDQQRGIMDSIHYASRIQQAILPHHSSMTKELGEHFVLFKPRDIVSGDFYWTNNLKGQKIIAAADCTGHGVPGAFMSMLGTAFLNDIGSSNKDLKASDILNLLRNDVINSLKQTGKTGEAKDGMDIALYILNEAEQKLQFAGANNPLFIIRPKTDRASEFQHKKISVQPFTQASTGKEFELIHIKGDKMPIGIYTQLTSFENIEIDIKPGDSLYTFSDGYVDQFGGPRGKKFMTKQMKQLLVNINNLSMPAQKDMLENSLVEWQKEEEQVDDILVIGFKIN